jgi:hypothetical protein
MRTFNGNHHCLYPNCKQKPIRSHIIAESVLEQLADQEGKVLTWNPTDHDIVISTIRGHEWDYVYKHPRKVGIRQEVTYPIFCDEHDNDVFAALEDKGFRFHPHQVALLAYRALCYKTWNPHLWRKFDFLFSNKDPQTTLEQKRIFSLKILLEARQKLEDILATQDYRQIQWITRILHIDPCFACANAHVSFHGKEDAKAIADGSVTLTPEDVMTYTLFPEKNLQASICVVTWFRDNSRSIKFLETLELDNPSEAIIRENILHNALRMSLVYASQAWWNTITPEQQEYVSELQLSNIKFLGGLESIEK